MKANIFNIQRFSIHDGPGIRTVVFFKGCPLRCPWCSNPESQHRPPQILWDKKKCFYGHLCEVKCPAGCLNLKITIWFSVQITVPDAKAASPNVPEKR